MRSTAKARIELWRVYTIKHLNVSYIDMLLHLMVQNIIYTDIKCVQATILFLCEISSHLLREMIERSPRRSSIVVYLASP